ncbi:MAG: PQQ-binding-like beta-propeller repeat protein, partial [Candidatus Aminicenantes bacterium]|nr:PQQ-binding-like beta-propeller repeat protein [Candidatus Aminicenantes bacterium]
KILWKYKAKNPLISAPLMGEEKIYVFDKKNTLYCLDEEGQLLWEKKTEEIVTSELKEDRKRLYWGTDEGGLVAFDPEAGEQTWRFQAGGAIRSGPVFSDSGIIFGCDDGLLYFLSRSGKLIGKFETGGKIEASPLVDGKKLYFGSHDQYFYGLDLKKRKKKWKVKTGGKILSQPVTDEKRVFFISWDSALYSLNKNNGTILWWQVLPSRSAYDLEIIEGKIVASSLSSTLVCFDIKTGLKKGTYDAGQEVRSNPLWLEPYLLISLYDYKQDKGRLVFLKKVVAVTLTPSKESPQKIGEEIVFSAKATGFFLPKYEFFLKTEDEKEIVQEISERGSWTWYPEATGDYTVGVNVLDAKEKAETEISFTIEKEEIQETGSDRRILP